MSASERLKALNERRSTNDMVTYHDALPEILAVIEAAERGRLVYEAAEGMKWYSFPPGVEDALAALEEKLS